MISIIMATYNGEKYLKEQIDSILNQSYNDFELIICDDCSNDNTRLILSEYSKKDSRIKLHFNEKNLGFKNNFENGVSLAQGDFIAFSDQDDIWENYKLQSAIDKIGNNDIYCSNALLVDENNNSLNKTMMQYLGIKYVPQDNIKKARHFLHGNICQGATMMCKTQFIKKNLPIPSCFYFHDWYFAILSATQNGIVYDSNCPLRYRQHQNTITESKQSKNKDTETIRIATIERNKLKIDICNFIIETSGFPDFLRNFAYETKSYYEKMNTKNDISTINFLIKYYNDMYWNKNIFNKSKIILKHFLGILKR